MILQNWKASTEALKGQRAGWKCALKWGLWARGGREATFAAKDSGDRAVRSEG